MTLFRYIAFPFVPFYYLATWVRNRLYDNGIKKSLSYEFPVICVGNLSVGGTGKTPMIEFLVNALKDDYKLATLSRGYKRKTTGFQLANDKSDAESIGDEPFQFYSKFKEAIQVAVDADRNNGIKNLMSLKNSPEVILLDDAFQHRKVKAGFYILLTTYNNPYCDDILLPTGDLREPRKGAKRADVIIVTKCPDTISEVEKETLRQKLKPEKYQDVFFSSISYADKVYSQKDAMALEGLREFTLVTGIANAMPLVNFLKAKGLKFRHLNYKDHHDFSNLEIESLNKEALIITTEKDFMRLKQYEVLKSKLYYLPIEVNIDREAVFNDLIKAYLTKH
ncbi:tetraacyldisaccharide 4'-kinase [Seonamhaeicola marinus]|uniref:Tetraacyldisaccharide 4'-kinase n=1 Tax=Seonamhaeicola marinus TaxID=1912246 RepID=A0A5D0IQU1_9FLAO|nr:tetraacyldisaccharide 4'-kinase [Seonamhaeicola marinus]TYA84082.1 tetraacyldisaccharide 4'-kinase [Seonamhaeicola marinus]